MRPRVDGMSRRWWLAILIGASIPLKSPAVAEFEPLIDLVVDRASRAREVRERIEGQRTSAIARLERVVAAYPDDPNAAAYHFQLAELMFEAERSENLARFEQALASAEVIRPRYPRARQRYEEVLARYPSSEQAVGALYGLAYCLEEEGQTAASIRTYEKLVGDHPDSPYASEAFVRLGEHYFAANRLEEAARVYEKVVQYPTSVLYEEALYKLGWTYYRLSDYARAISTFTYLVDDARADGDGDYQGMAEEAKSYIAITFSEYGGVEQLERYIDQIGERPYAAEILLSLGGLLRGSGDFPEAESAFRAVVDRYSDSRLAPEAQRELVDLLEVADRSEDAMIARERFASLFAAGTKWHQQWASDDVADEVAQSAQEHHYTVAAYLHRRYRSGQDSGDLHRAVDLYERYLENYPLSRRTRQVHLQMADGWLNLGDRITASKMFEKASRLSDDDPQAGRASADALFNAIVVLDTEGIATDDRSQGRLSELTDQFVLQYPNEARVSKLLIRRGDIGFETGRFADAAADFDYGFTATIDPVLAEHARLMAARALFEIDDFASAECWLAMSDENSEADHALLLASIYRQAEVYRDRGNLESAYLEFERVVSTAPESESAPLALYEAALTQLDAGDPVRAVENLERLTQGYPTHDLVSDALGRASVICYDRGDLFAASGLLERLAAIEPDTPGGEEASCYSARYREEAQDPEGARRLYEQHRNAYPAFTVRGMDLRLREIRLANNQGAPKLELKSLLDQVLNAPRPEASAYPHLLAEASFLDAELEGDAYYALRIEEPLAETTERKEVAMNALVDAYARSAEFRVAEWSVGAFLRIGGILEDFGGAMMDAPAPSDLTEIELELYAMQIEDYTAPYREQALESYLASVEMATEHNLVSDHARNAWARIQELNSDLLAGLEAPRGVMPAAPDADATLPLGSTSPTLALGHSTHGVDLFGPVAAASEATAPIGLGTTFESPQSPLMRWGATGAGIAGVGVATYMIADGSVATGALLGAACVGTVLYSMTIWGDDDNKVDAGLNPALQNDEEKGGRANLRIRTDARSRQALVEFSMELH